MGLRHAGFECIARRRVGSGVSFTSISISFVSLDRVLPGLGGFLGSSNRTMYLVGPRFRTKGRGINGGNIIHSGTIRTRIIRGVVSLTDRGNFSIYKLSFSPIGNPRNGVRCLVCLGGDIGPIIRPKVSTRFAIRGSRRRLR